MDYYSIICIPEDALREAQAGVWREQAGEGARLALARNAAAYEREQVLSRIESARKRTIARYPKPDARMRERGCVEIAWDAETEEAKLTEETLRDVITSVAMGETDESVLEQAWKDFVRARMRRWEQGRVVEIDD